MAHPQRPGNRVNGEDFEKDTQNSLEQYSTDETSTQSSTVAEKDLGVEFEKQRGAARTRGHGLTRTSSQPGVDVERAEQEFAELSKEMSKVSEWSRKIYKSGSRPSLLKASVSNFSETVAKTNGRMVTDIEKGVDSDGSSEESFDLEATLRGGKRREEESGIRSKRIGVIWDNLTVKGIGGAKNYVRTFPDAFVSFFNVFGTLMHCFGLGRKGKEISILENFRGVVKPGEMVLVLGRPGSGCTSFLKVISNQRFGYTAVDGEVLYGPFDSETFAKRYRGEAVYNREDDIHHHPTLSVGQTLSFAMDCKIPGKRAGGISKRDFKDAVINTLLKMFNIEHTRNTIVGDQFHRGISGGERKRVSIAEMMITSATVCAWDNTTRGLDASTAVDYAKSLRIMTNIYKTSTFVSLYQASETIYAQFDKVMVIDKGRQVFFGPASEARSYFEGLGFLEKPRQTTPDYLTGCTDPFEREYKDGRKGASAPRNAKELEAAFNESVYGNRLEEEMKAYRLDLNEEQHIHEDFQIAVKESKRHAPQHSVYSIPFHTQVYALIQRQFLLKWQDKFILTVSWITTITVAIVLGTVWLNLPRTSAGAFTRGGVLFISLLFNCFQAFGELGATMLGRPIINKHRAFTFYRPSALWLAQITVDLIFAAARILVFSIIVYFMTGLVRDAGAFFTFYLLIITGFAAMTLFFRTVGCMCPDFDYAIKFASVMITLFVITSGYIIQYESEKVWLRWIFYINPLGLGFSSLMMNEFKRIDMTCVGASLVPSGLQQYNNINYQSCTLQGSKPGNSIVPGRDYVQTGFSYDPSDLWRNWGLIIVLICGFLVANVTLGECIKWGAGGKTVTFYAKENEERQGLNGTLEKRREARLHKEIEQSDSGLKVDSRAVITWEDICYDVPVPSGQVRLLKNIYGYVKPGQLTALMGASGAGKTTLLDVLASRKNIGVISGEKLVDGSVPDTAFQRGTSYAEQLDVHESTATVREALRFSANLRQPYDVPQSEKYAYVEEVISLLEMEDIADAIIGNIESGLAVEQRKRVTIGVELAAKPELLLFLDEPTSGLDSQSAFNIVRFLRKLASRGQAILCTIHQPNSALFENFDRLLLLQHGGECVYFGDIGKDASVLISYFGKHGAKCPPNANPAEWMLDAIGAGSTPRIGDRDWGEIWLESGELQQTKQLIRQIKTERLREVGSAPQTDQKEYATPLWHQIKVVNARTHKAFWRSPNYGFTRFFNHVVVALLTGLTYLHLGDSRASLQYRVFVIFQATVLPALILAQVEPKYDLSRLIFYRESAAKAYKPLPFALAMVLAEMPYSVLCAIGFFLPLYYLPGFQQMSSRAGYQFLMILITEVFSVTLGQMVSALTPSTYIAMLMNPFIIINFALFCGVTIPKPQIPGFWRAWLYQLDPFTRLVGGMVVTELHGRPVVCQPHEFNTFPPPPGQTCGSYMEPYFAAGGIGYIADNSSTTQCNFCAYKEGDQFYEGLDLSFAHRWRDLGILAVFIGSNLTFLFLGSRYLNFNRR
ncbi:putative ABC transporter [Viridothelium virens]|uniref:Putative ABC transporter n=1 Tax=Viridothelium virens TaxID=1048519 RepID=A0A6A6HDH4_VIRVR|nr:putative ABC transporter [Viridothelium virens]